MPPSFGFLWFGLLKTVGALAVMSLLSSLAPAVWADPPATLRPRGATRSDADVAALFRAADALGGDKKVGAARAALLERFPPGSDPSALVAFLAGAGHGRCEPTTMGTGHRGYYCLVSHGAFAALVLGLDRWRLREWVVGVSLAPDTGTIGDIGVRIPLLGKG